MTSFACILQYNHYRVYFFHRGTVVSVAFEEDSYRFKEGSRDAEVCLTLTGSIQRTVSVQIHENDTTEQGKFRVYIIGAIIIFTDYYFHCTQLHTTTFTMSSQILILEAL